MGTDQKNQDFDIELWHLENFCELCGDGVLTELDFVSLRVNSPLLL